MHLKLNLMLHCQGLYYFTNTAASTRTATSHLHPRPALYPQEERIHWDERVFVYSFTVTAILDKLAAQANQGWYMAVKGGRGWAKMAEPKYRAPTHQKSCHNSADVCYVFIVNFLTDTTDISGPFRDGNTLWNSVYWSEHDQSLVSWIKCRRIDRRCRD